MKKYIELARKLINVKKKNSLINKQGIQSKTMQGLK